jgi:hypothetical protein
MDAYMNTESPSKWKVLYVFYKILSEIMNFVLFLGGWVGLL